MLTAFLSQLRAIRLPRSGRPFSGYGQPRSIAQRRFGFALLGCTAVAVGALVLAQGTMHESSAAYTDTAGAQTVASSSPFAVQLQNDASSWVVADSFPTRVDRAMTNPITWQGYGESARLVIPFRLAPEAPQGDVQFTLVKKANPCGAVLTTSECDKLFSDHLKITLSYDGAAPFIANASFAEVNALTTQRTLRNVSHTDAHTLVVELSLASNTPLRYSNLSLPFYVELDAVTVPLSTSSGCPLRTDSCTMLYL